MSYWRGWMNWPLDPDWGCEICKRRDLMWGLQHGECRCDNCHMPYMMIADDGKTSLTRPVIQIKDDYRAAAIAGWAAWRTSISTWDDDKWDAAFALAAGRG